MAKKKIEKKEYLLAVKVSLETKKQLAELKKEYGINKNVSVRNAIAEYYAKRNNN